MNILDKIKNRLNLVSKNEEFLHFEDTKNNLRIFKNPNKSIDIIINTGPHYANFTLKRDQVEFIYRWIKNNKNENEITKI